ncbi:CopD family protein [Deinococcus yavapaiensis]|uniref:Putative copper resistance protein D/copper transport protein n=1 Tax=Deinococcus yavapaiensis KR-236 TaxID=694435 RepID=A0A318SKE9_9DEIO|nr:CopD family protein [Deinococcus yavapaiensis]PYE54829.1 putative copper resistance protein D/copper transport protein [Deinococcus yavapaiensis KR-236]
MLWLPKTLLYLGLALLLGGAVFRRFVSPEPRSPLRPLVVGALLVVVGALGTVTLTLSDLLGPFGLADFAEYLLSSSGGTAVLATLALTAAVLAFEGQPVRTWIPTGVAGALLLASVAEQGHGRQSILLLGLHVVHLAAMTAWIGAVVFLVGFPRDEATFWRGVERLSNLGLCSVAVLVATGLAATVLALPGVGALTGSTYGLALLVKLGFFGGVLLLAALNKLDFLKRRKLPQLRGALRVEAALLVSVLASSGVLATTAPPEVPAAALVTPFETTLGGRPVRGEFSLEPGGVLSARIEAEHAPSAVLHMTEHTMPPIQLTFTRTGSVYTARTRLWMSGAWKATVRVNDTATDVPLNVR